MLCFFSQLRFIQSRHPNIVQTDPLITGFAQALTSRVPRDDDTIAACKKWHIYLLHQGPCLSLCPNVFIISPAHPPWTLHCSTRLQLHWGKTQTPSAVSFGKCKELPDSRFPQRHTQEALLKPRLNPTLLCPMLHATIHLEDSLLSWRGSCTLTPQGHSDHSIGRYSNPGSVTEGQGETLSCFLLWNPCRAADKYNLKHSVQY